MNQPARKVTVRLTADAATDIRRLHKRDPSISRMLLRRMLFLENSPHAGEPLLGALVGFRKLVAGNRQYRIVWRIDRDDKHGVIVEIAEVWAAGARSDGDVYDEMRQRIEEAKRTGAPETRPLVEVIEEMGRLYLDTQAQTEPQPQLPEWLIQALREQLHVTDARIAGLTQEEAQQLLAEHWSKPK